MKIAVPCAECSEVSIYRCTDCGKSLCTGCAFRRERERLCEVCCDERDGAEIDADLRGDAARMEA